jgi:hypothetical protein
MMCVDLELLKIKVPQLFRHAMMEQFYGYGFRTATKSESERARQNEFYFVEPLANGPMGAFRNYLDIRK